MSRTPFVGGNFKATGTSGSITTIVSEFNSTLTGHGDKVEVVLAPPSLYLERVKALARGEIQVAAQNCIPKSGAFTGEVSLQHVQDVGLKHVILGHSERRHVFGETDKVIRAKTEATVRAGVTAILCVGETLHDREALRTQQVVQRQLVEATKGLAAGEWERVVIAYEPVWAIGTGKVATPQQAQDVVAFIRQVIAHEVSPDVAARCRIIYGGSVNAKNVANLWDMADIDGFLVGGASTKPEFSKIVKQTLAPKGQAAKL